MELLRRSLKEAMKKKFSVNNILESLEQIDANRQLGEEHDSAKTRQDASDRRAFLLFKTAQVEIDDQRSRCTAMEKELTSVKE